MIGKRILALTTDSFGGRGGIAVYARDMIAAIAARDDVAEVVVVAIVVPDAPQAIPPKVRFLDRSTGGKTAYVAEVARLALTRFDAVWAAHRSLAPLALMAAARGGARIGISLHGSEVWEGAGPLTEMALRRADLLMPVSEVTLDRYLTARGENTRVHRILPGAVDLHRFTPGARPPYLIQRYGLEERRVLLSVARLGEDYREKGFSRMFAALPALRSRFPDLVYVIGGDGPFRHVVEQAAHVAGVAEMVRFIGFVAEAEKPDHYRMADAFILPSTGEGLGIVLLEAQACGVPAIASSLDGGREAVDRMGWAIDPNDPAAIGEALAEAFARAPERPAGIEAFGLAAFTRRANTAFDWLLS